MRILEMRTIGEKFTIELEKAGSNRMVFVLKKDDKEVVKKTLKESFASANDFLFVEDNHRGLFVFTVADRLPDGEPLIKTFYVGLFAEGKGVIPLLEIQNISSDTFVWPSFFSYLQSVESGEDQNLFIVEELRKMELDPTIAKFEILKHLGYAFARHSVENKLSRELLAEMLYKMFLNYTLVANYEELHIFLQGLSSAISTVYDCREVNFTREQLAKFVEILETRLSPALSVDVYKANFTQQGCFITGIVAGKTQDGRLFLAPCVFDAESIFEDDTSEATDIILNYFKNSFERALDQDTEALIVAVIGLSKQRTKNEDKLSEVVKGFFSVDQKTIEKLTDNLVETKELVDELLQILDKMENRG